MNREREFGLDFLSPKVKLEENSKKAAEIGP